MNPTFLCRVIFWWSTTTGFLVVDPAFSVKTCQNARFGPYSRLQIKHAPICWSISNSRVVLDGGSPDPWVSIRFVMVYWLGWSADSMDSPMTLETSYQSSSGWWFQPLWKILVNRDDYSQYMEHIECSKPPTSLSHLEFPIKSASQKRPSDWWSSELIAWTQGPADQNPKYKKLIADCTHGFSRRIERYPLVI